MSTQDTAYVHKGGNAKLGAFGANGKEPQTAVTVAAAAGARSATYVQAEAEAVRALVNQLRAALIANGICV